MSVLEGGFEGRTLVNAVIGGGLGALVLMNGSLTVVSQMVALPYVDRVIAALVAGATAGYVHWKTREVGIPVGALAGFLTFVFGWTLVATFVLVVAAVLPVSIDGVGTILVGETGEAFWREVAAQSAVHVAVLLGSGAVGGYIGGLQAERKQDSPPTRT